MGEMGSDLPNRQLKKYRVLAIFLARGGSKRIKNKNIVNFNGKPIIYNGLNGEKIWNFAKNIHLHNSLNKKVVEKFDLKLIS